MLDSGNAAGRPDLGESSNRSRGVRARAHNVRHWKREGSTRLARCLEIETMGSNGSRSMHDNRGVMVGPELWGSNDCWTETRTRSRNGAERELMGSNSGSGGKEGEGGSTVVPSMHRAARTVCADLLLARSARQIRCLENELAMLRDHLRCYTRLRCIFGARAWK